MFGALVAFAGVEHGVGEILQGPVGPARLAIESWPDVKAFEILGDEPALTVIPNLLVSGVLAVIVAFTLGIWSVMFVERRYGGLVLISLSVLLLLVGGGFGPVLMAVGLGRRCARLPGLFPGLVVLSWLFGVSDPNLVLVLSAVSFAGLLVASVAGRAHDRLHSG